DGLIRRLDLGDSALTGAQQRSKLDLSQALLLPKVAHRIAELEAELHIGSLIRSQAQEFFGRSNFPALCLQARLLLFIHLGSSYLYPSYSASRRLQASITALGVA